MAQPKVKMAKRVDKADLHVATITESQAQNLEGHTKFIVQEAASCGKRRYLRGQGCGIGMLLQTYADDLVFVRLGDVALRNSLTINLMSSSFLFFSIPWLYERCMSYVLEQPNYLASPTCCACKVM